MSCEEMIARAALDEVSLGCFRKMNDDFKDALRRLRKNLTKDMQDVFEVDDIKALCVSKRPTFAQGQLFKSLGEACRDAS